MIIHYLSKYRLGGVYVLLQATFVALGKHPAKSLLSYLQIGTITYHLGLSENIDHTLNSFFKNDFCIIFN